MKPNPMDPIIKDYERHLTRLHEIHRYALTWAAEEPGPLTMMFEMAALGLVHHCNERIRMSLIMKDLFDFPPTTPPPVKPSRKKAKKSLTTHLRQGSGGQAENAEGTEGRAS